MTLNINFFFKNPCAYTPQRFQQEASKIGRVAIFNPIEISIIGEAPFHSGQPLPKCDIAFFRGSVEDKSRTIIMQLSELYSSQQKLSVNSASAIALTANKWNTIQALKQNGLPTAKSCILKSKSEISTAIQYLEGFPVVVKFQYGSGGIGVVKVNDECTLTALYDAYSVLELSFMVEQFIPVATEGVFRVIVAGDRVIAAIKHHPKEGDFRSNLAKGGTGERDRIPYEIEQLGMNAIRACGLITGGADIVMQEGKPYILEVNSSPGIELAERVTGENIAGAILKAIIEKEGI